MDDGTFVIMGFVHGLGPNPLHGFHIHEFGNLSDDDCESVGDSFYDLGNIAADPGGNSVVNIVDTQVKLTGDAEDSVAGKVIIENSRGGRFLWNRNLDLGWIWADWPY